MISLGHQCFSSSLLRMNSAFVSSIGSEYLDGGRETLSIQMQSLDIESRPLSLMYPYL